MSNAQFGMPQADVAVRYALAQSTSVAVQAVDLVKDYGAGASVVHALRGVNVSFAQGAFTAIMGPSGSGKSTLMHTLAGLDAATSGRILFEGKDITKLKDNELTLLRRESIGFIFQSFNLLPMFTTEQNILMPLTLAGKKPDRAWFAQLVSTLGLSDRLEHRPNELSGGQQQRVAIARALITKPTIVFADEPTGNLDSVSSAEVLGFLRRSVKELGQTIIMVTHDAIAASYADRAIVFADGRIVADQPEPQAEQMSELRNQVRSNLLQGEENALRAPAPAGAHLPGSQAVPTMQAQAGQAAQATQAHQSHTAPVSQQQPPRTPVSVTTTVFVPSHALAKGASADAATPASTDAAAATTLDTQN